MPIYFDHNATTPVNNEVFDVMLPYMREHYANPSSVHTEGRIARQAIDRAREQVADLVDAHPSQVIFTSGGTEANNFALKGTMQSLGLSNLFVSAIEHPSVRDVAKYFADACHVVELPVDKNGLLETEALSRVISKNKAGLVSVMLANNETGVIQDIPFLSSICRKHGFILHTDAVQAAGKLAVSFANLGVDLMTLSAHKIYGPKGVGALIMNKRLDLQSLILGGGQERSLRSGTENVAAIAGFGKAAELAKENLEKNISILNQLQQYFEDRLKQIPGIVLFGADTNRLPNTSFFSVEGIDGETLLMQLDNHQIAVTSGSACSSKSLSPSHVLVAMGIDNQIARNAIRVSFGVNNTQAEVDEFIRVLQMQVQMINSLSLLNA